MTERPALSKGEMEGVRVLWELGSASVRQVHEALPSDREVDFTTVKTDHRSVQLMHNLGDPRRTWSLHGPRKHGSLDCGRQCRAPVFANHLGHSIKTLFRNLARCFQGVVARR
jgi:hypothetical protein